MKKYNIILILLLAIAPSIVLAGNNTPKGKYTKEKRVTKEYTVNSNATLEIDNSYGEVNMVTWNENRVVIEVHVKTNSNDEDQAQDKLDDIDVRFEGNSNYVSARTNFNNSSRSWWNSWRSSNVNMEVNYTIKLPVTNAIDISNDYGGISLNKLEGTAKISCDYGKLTIGDLLGENNYLNFDYTKNSSINYVKSGSINANYSSFKLDNGDTIDLNADYTKSELGKIKDLNYTCDYGSIITEEIEKLRGRGDYLTAKIGRVNKDLNIVADYGSIKIDEISPNANNIRIQSDYTGIKLGYHNDYHFKFDIKLQYAGLSGKEDLTILKEHKRSSDRSYEGYHGDASSSNTLSINSEYGGVTLYKN